MKLDRWILFILNRGLYSNSLSKHELILSGNKKNICEVLPGGAILKVLSGQGSTNYEFTIKEILYLNNDAEIVCFWIWPIWFSFRKILIVTLFHFFLLIQLWPVFRRIPSQERHSGDHRHTQGLAQRAQEEPVPNQGGEDHAGHHHKDDAHTGLLTIS